MGGRMLGGAILGFSIGCMVALVERFAREAALVVHWDENERTTINLGPTPVVLGSSPEAHLYLPAEKGFPPETAVVTFQDGVVELENLMTETRHTLHNGNKLEIGSLLIEIQTDSK
jgi:Ca-activated chloride channel family protein